MWTEDQRTLLDLVLDELVPASADGRIPGAGALGVAEFLPSATPYASDPIGAVLRVLGAVSEKSADFGALPRADRVRILTEVEADQADAFSTLVHLTYMGYYSRSDTRPLFGVGAHPVHPDGYPVEREGDALIEDLTAPVLARGRTYRG